MNIYRILHVASGKSYIGRNAHQDPERRWKRHQREALNPRSDVYDTHFHRAIRKYGSAAFEFSSLAFTDSRKDLTSLEIEFIKKLKTDDPQYGYNSTAGGEGWGAYNDIARKKLSEAQKRAWGNSPERKEALSRRTSGENNNFWGIDHSGENNGFYGKTHSGESRKRISEGRAGKGLGPKPKISEGGRRAWKRNPQRRELQGKQMKALWSDPVFRERMDKLFATEEYKKKSTRKHPSPTKIVWPVFAELVSMVKNSSYASISRSLGVSPAAVRKHIVKNIPSSTTK